MDTKGIVGQTIGAYRITRLLGRGGMGAVYEAQHLQLGRRAAIKLLHPQFSEDEEMARRFFNEARSVNLISHPGIVDISEFGTTPNGTIYIVMEYLEGRSLRQQMADRGPDPESALRIGYQVSAALAAAHEKGIVHRDLKPDNIMLLPDPLVPGGERIKLLDFGIAKMAEDQTSTTGLRTKTGALLGTPAYMSPEQCRGAGQVDDRTDVYSLGVVLYQMATGELPLVAQGLGEQMALHMFQTPKAPKERNPDLSDGLNSLIIQMLGKTRESRPAMEEVRGTLESMQAKVPAARPAQKTAQTTADRASVAPPVATAVPSTLGRGAAEVQRTPDKNRRMSSYLGIGGIGALAVLVLAGGTWVITRPSSGGTGGSVSTGGLSNSNGSGNLPKVPEKTESPTPPLPPIPTGQVDLLHSVPSSILLSSTVRNKRIQPQGIADENMATAWNSRTGDLIGATVAFSVPQEVRIRSIQLTPGYARKDLAKNEDLFALNHRIRKIEIFQDEVSLGTFDLDTEDRTLQTISLGDRSGGDYKLVVREVAPGSKKTWQEICISELRVLGVLPAWMKAARHSPMVTVMPAQIQSGTAELPIKSGPNSLLQGNPPWPKTLVLKVSAEDRGIHSRGTRYYDFVLALDLPGRIEEQVKSVQYRFPKETMPKQPLRTSSKAADGFAIKYHGWGCIRGFEVDLLLHSGEVVTLGEGDMCSVLGWED